MTSPDEILLLQAAAMSEEALRQNVRSAMLTTGWLHAHTYDSCRSDAGLPDILGARRPRVLAIECKAKRGRLTDEQRTWALELIENPGVEYLVLRPTDWLDGTVLAVLTASAPPMEIIERILEREGLA